MPEVSVVMPVYDPADLPALKAAVDSIKNQTFKDWEMVICGDGCTERTLQAVRQAAGGDARIKIIRSRKNRGAGPARNACIRASSGKYIAVMDADDISHPQRLEKQLDFLERHPEYALAGCSAKLFDSRGVWGERILEEKPDREAFLRTLPFVHPSIMVRREAAEEIHGYAETPQTLRVEDYDFLMRLYARGYRGYNLQEMLFCYREDRQSYKRRRYRHRLSECRVRCARFRELGILRGNLRYVLKPLAVGMIPGVLMRAYKKNRYRPKCGRAGRKRTDRTAAEPERRFHAG